ncbi:unnamed protein product [Blepharisma stoltei]|uniref:Uncharacterized protein n=1 Tax=Blepharisma stoltei TaxID=1481888 RepID=A0AAU9J1J6_9CILI|nr:unnamed protein product [Blepharisma stoltei]
MNSIFSFGEAAKFKLQNGFQHQRHFSPINEVLNVKNESRSSIQRRFSNIRDEKISGDLDDLKRIIEKCIRSKSNPRNSSWHKDEEDIKILNNDSERRYDSKPKQKLKKSEFLAQKPKKKKHKIPSLVISNRTPSPNIFLSKPVSFPNNARISKDLDKVRQNIKQRLLYLSKLKDTSGNGRFDNMENNLASNSLLLKSVQLFSPIHKISKTPTSFN